jgi:hypothetical protein
VLGGWALFMTESIPYDSKGILKGKWMDIINTMVMNGETITGRKLLERYGYRLDIKRLEGPEEGSMDAGPLETNWSKLTVAPLVDGEQLSPKPILLMAEKQPSNGRIFKSRPLPKMEQRPEGVKPFLSTAKSPIKVEALSKTRLPSRAELPAKHEPVLGGEALVKRELRPEEIPLPPSPVLHATTVP